MDWQVIESAPKDGRTLLLWFSEAKRPCQTGRWVHSVTLENGAVTHDAASWRVDTMIMMTSFGEPTHWAPIIAPDADKSDVLAPHPSKPASFKDTF